MYGSKTVHNPIGATHALTRCAAPMGLLVCENPQDPRLAPWATGVSLPTGAEAYRAMLTLNTYLPEASPLETSKLIVSSTSY